MDYKITQKFKYQGLSDGMLGIGLVFMFFLVLLTMLALKKRDSINRSVAVAISSGLAPQTSFTAPPDHPPQAPYPTAAPPLPPSWAR